MSFQFADLMEHTVDAIGDRPALACLGIRRTFDELEDRCNRLAHHLTEEGFGPGDHIGIYGLNSLAWVETMFAAFKIRAIPININYRYVEEELRYLFGNADLKGVAFDGSFAPRIDAVRDDLPLLEHLLAFDRGGEDETLDRLGAADYEQALAGSSPDRDFPPREPDDLVIIYTGGTTGMPKGVMWRHEDIFYALAGGIDPFTREPVPDEWSQSRKAADSPGGLVFLNTPPLMHGAAFVATAMNIFQGNTSVLVPHFDATDVWRTIATERVNSVLIVGDAMGRPMIEALEALEFPPDGSEPELLDLSSLLSVSSSAAVFSPSVKERFLDRFPNLVITDSIGATESGFNGLITVGRGNTAMKGGGPTVNPGRDTLVLDDDLRPVEPGSGIVGRVARAGNLSLGYYKDEAKTAETFVEAPDGRRYVIPGDFATVEADGSITLLGRGSVCINTGGEKVYPEEVEQTLKGHPKVFDAIVVGTPDDRWGQKVTAIVEAREGDPPTLAELDAFCRSSVAGYKVPRELHLVEEIVRSPSGKPDYRWAKDLATSATHLVP